METVKYCSLGVFSYTPFFTVWCVSSWVAVVRHYQSYGGQIDIPFYPAHDKIMDIGFVEYISAPYSYQASENLLLVHQNKGTRLHQLSTLKLLIIHMQALLPAYATP